MLAMFWEIARWRAGSPAPALRSAALVTSSNKKAPPKEWPAGAGQVRWPIRGREGGRSLPTEFFVTRPAYLSADFARSRRPTTTHLCTDPSSRSSSGDVSVHKCEKRDGEGGRRV